MKKIMLVDQRPEFGRLVQSVVPDHEVRQAVTATTGFAVALFWQPDLFIIDLQLPDMRGSELVDLLHQDDSLSHIPVLFASPSLDQRTWTEESPVLVGDGQGAGICLTGLREYILAHLEDTVLRAAFKGAA
jgi:CheY-like chemotaxis protein